MCGRTTSRCPRSTDRRRTKTSSGHRERVLAEYAKLAPDYDARWARYTDASIRETLARLPLAAGDRVLDVGSGTGALLERLALVHPEARLSGLEPVPEMLTAARRRLPAAVELHEGWAEHLPFDAGRFDAVVSSNAFHYVDDPEASLREIQRVLRPGGRLVITDWCDDYIACRLCGVYLRLFRRAHFRAYRRRECDLLLRRAGFADVRVERYKIDWLWGLFTATARVPAG